MDIKYLAEICHHTFNTSAGTAFLSYLKQTYLDPDVYAPGRTFEHTAYNEGHRYVVREILSLREMYLSGNYPQQEYGASDGGADEYATSG